MPPTAAEVLLPNTAPASSSETSALGVWTLRTREAPGWDPAKYIRECVWVIARGGIAHIPVILIRHRDARPDSMHAGWQIGYGPHGVSYDPESEALHLSTLRRVVYTIMHVRGGGGVGHSWCEDGKGLVKEHALADFIDVVDWLINPGWVAPGHLVMEGHNVRGLLMGTVTNAAPDRFRTILASVPFVDAPSTTPDPTPPLTVDEWEEWGNPPTSHVVLDVTSRCTPYESVPDGVPLPAVMAATSVNGTRVEFVESTKWVQRLHEAAGQVPSASGAGAGQCCNCCDSGTGEVSVSERAGHGLVVVCDPFKRLIILRTEAVAGHAGPPGHEGQWAAHCEEFAFASGQVGIIL